MIITHIIGGLGNQMFQYALGLSLSLDRDSELLLDINNANHHNGFELGKVFNIKTKIATKADIKQVLGARSGGVARRQMRKHHWFRSKHYVLEPHFHYDKNIINIPNRVYLKGHWHSEKYFIKYKDEILKAFAFNENISSKNQEIIHQIQQYTSISIHIRRGDYVNSNAFNVLDINYYKNAIRQLNIKDENILFVLFSDDITWVKENSLNLLANKKYLIIDNNINSQSYNDIHLMALCDHNIIANSSFSWWGAYLNQNSNKQVVAPKKWFADNRNLDDLCPKSWIKL